MQLLKDLDKVLTRTAVDRSTRWFGKKMTMSEVLARQDFSVKEEVEGSGGRVKQAHLVPKINADEPVGKGLLETIRNLGAKGDPQRTYICVLQIAVSPSSPVVLFLPPSPPKKHTKLSLNLIP